MCNSFFLLSLLFFFFLFCTFSSGSKGLWWACEYILSPNLCVVFLFLTNTISQYTTSILTTWLSYLHLAKMFFPFFTFCFFMEQYMYSSTMRHVCVFLVMPTGDENCKFVCLNLIGCFEVVSLAPPLLLFNRDSQGSSLSLSLSLWEGRGSARTEGSGWLPPFALRDLFIRLRLLAFS